MLNKLVSIYLGILITTLSSAYADAHVGVGLSASAITKVSKQILGNFQSFNFRIDENKFILENKVIREIEIIDTLSEFADIAINQDIPVHWETSSLRTKLVFGDRPVDVTFSEADGSIYLNIALSIDDFDIKVKQFNFCEKFNTRRHHCLPDKDQLFLNLKDLNVTKGSKTPLKLNIKSKLTVKDQKAKFRVVKIDTNIEKINLNLNIGDFNIPVPTLEIDGEIFELNMDTIKSEIFAQQHEMAKLIANGVNVFVSEHLVGEINSQLVDKISDFELNPKIVAFRDLSKKKGTVEYRRNKRDIKFNKDLEAKVDNTSVDNRRYYYEKRNLQYSKKEEGKPYSRPGIMTEIFSEFIQQVYQADIQLQYKTLFVANPKHLVLGLDSKIELNNESVVKETHYLNGERRFNGIDRADFASTETDFSLAISEPYLNSLLKISSTQELLESIVIGAAGIEGVSIRNLDIHLASKTNAQTYICKNTNKNCLSSTKAGIYLVFGLDVQTSKVKVSEKYFDSLYGVLGKLNPDVYLPVEIALSPKILKSEDGKDILRLVLGKAKYLNPYTRNLLVFGHEVKDPRSTLSSIVNRKIREKLQEGTEKYVDIELNTLLENDTFSVMPRKVKITDSGFLKLDIDLIKLDVKRYIDINKIKRNLEGR